MILIAGSFQIVPSALADVTAAASAMAAASRLEPGCLDYRFSFDIDDPHLMRLNESWESEDALAEHFTLPHFAAFSAALDGAVSGSSEFLKYQVASVGPLFS